MDDISKKYPIGSVPTIHYLPYLIIISYIVSLIGAFTTVELLHRRVTGPGWRNWVQLGACSVSFGLVAIWCMHFVGNRAIILGGGEKEIQLYYSSSFTAVSAILPIIVIFMGLLIVDRFYKGSKSFTTRYLALLGCGICTGASVTEMHYLGNQGTSNYRLIPVLPYIIGAAIIAVVACCVAFTLFFHWSKHWINNLRRRILVSCVLAIAVAGMHWTAAAGTSYELQGYHVGPGQARNTNLIIAVCLCLAACSVCFAIGFLKQRHNKKLKDRAQQGGLMPCQTITNQFYQRTFDEEFNVSHPVYQWLYRVSRHWNGIIELIPAMREHLGSTGYLSNVPVGSTGSETPTEDEADTNYSAAFRELFCVTAQDIARSLDTRLQDLGDLYEDVLTTGTLLNKNLWRDQHGKNIIAADVVATPGDIEAGLAKPILFGKGQLLILTRKVKTEEANRLQNNGYRFASLDQVGDTLARSLQIGREDLNLLIGRLNLFCQRDNWALSKGIYLAAFLLQPSPTMNGLDVVVPRLTPDRLPMVQFASDELSSRQLKVLAEFDGLTMDECLVRIGQRSGTDTEDDLWLEKFRNVMVKLLQDVTEPVLRQATFSCQQLNATHGITGQNVRSYATVFAFCGIKEIYNRSLRSQALRYVPWSFFRTQQRVYPGCPDHMIFAQKNHKEFSTLLASAPKSPSPSHAFKWPRWGLRSQSSARTAAVQPDSSSEKGLVNTDTSMMSVHNVSYAFGGIMVSQEVVIDEDQKESHIELADMGVRAEAGVADKEQQTMAEKLLLITSALRDPSNKLSRDLYGRR